MQRRAIIACLATLPLLPRPAAAAQRQPFTEAALEAAQAADRPILIEVTAPWCPTCRAQKPHVDAVAADPRMAGAVLLSIDFDSQKDALRRFQVRSQSTLIAMKGREERGRATGITDGAAIRDLLFRAL
ncbi:thioredoxin family protein [Roseomonas stagni]|uniref:Thioredoxin family protein n=1 Tax=Falsiroseomonas algicola TaxID=2716930 RepID=A0A6M1LTR6_9PROT|nr:thioredoxin family protein [Falsiroseomonas algicola]NGM23840.1 thioredoxin family protein [Falsiroseomonas algicola]